jgi:hypothetical protein
MPHPSKRKGSGFEREVVAFLRDQGIVAERVPLSGAAGGSHTGDIDVSIRGTDRKLECKRRARGFSTLYGWLAGNYALIVRDDHCEPLAVMRLTDFAQLTKVTNAET